ncbi:MAG: Nif11-like leader peptide family natural product precursor [Lachnospiraceae bacterium]|nr:Nif11-like leader peptide family natural product precursor [Lachnospiraceae bacterium]
MSMDNVKKLMAALESDPEARKKVEDIARPSDRDGYIRYYVEVGKRLGLEITEDDIREGVEQAAKELSSRTDSLSDTIEKLPDEELGMVAGGKKGHSNCKDTFKNRENCYFDDGCDFIFLSYDNYKCDRNYNGHQCGDKHSRYCTSALAEQCTSFLYDL